ANARQSLCDWSRPGCFAPPSTVRTHPAVRTRPSGRTARCDTAVCPETACRTPGSSGRGAECSIRRSCCWFNPRGLCTLKRLLPTETQLQPHLRVPGPLTGCFALGLRCSLGGVSPGIAWDTLPPSRLAPRQNSREKEEKEKGEAMAQMRPALPPGGIH